MVIIDKKGIVRDIMNEYFPRATCHVSPKDKTKAIRQERLARLVKYASEHGVRYYVVENLDSPLVQLPLAFRYSIEGRL